MAVRGSRWSFGSPTSDDPSGIHADVGLGIEDLSGRTPLSYRLTAQTSDECLRAGTKRNVIHTSGTHWIRNHATARDELAILADIGRRIENLGIGAHFDDRFGVDAADIGL